MISINNQRIVDQEIVLDAKKEVYYLGPDLVLENCNVIFKVSARSIIMHWTGIRLVGCNIQAKRPLVNMQWLDANMEKCSFNGKLSGNDFGNWPESGHRNGGIQNCTFVNAELDGCRFVGCDISTIRFPGWPHFVIVNPKEHFDLWASQNWPTNQWQHIFIEVLRTESTEVSATVYHLPALLKDQGGYEREIRMLLENINRAVPGAVLL